MSTPPRGAADRPRAVETRLRAALDARARLITPHSLGPAAPPTGPAWGTRRIRRVAAGVLVAAAAVVAVCVLLLPTGSGPDRDRPAPPARDPRTSEAPATPRPTPTPSTDPSASPSRTGGPPPTSAVPTYR
ncbi:hypothetical protein ABVG11_24570 [Streptomyces sp. HD1123-B1]|uniref:hypothetical protein n=1 Tax=Streptomyces huangiella TaxID=3228804 RepID=UPI003D7EC4D8